MPEMSDLIEIRVPSEDEEGTTSTVLRWIKQPGQSVSQHEPVLELSTDKATVEIAAPVSGVVESVLKPEGTQVEPGEVLGRVRVGAAASPELPASDVAAASRGSVPPADAGKAEAEQLSPAVRRLLQQHQLTPSQVRGSGRGGRITVEDVERQIAQASPNPPVGSRRIPHSPIRKAIAEHMVLSMLRTAPHVTAVHECDLSQVLAHRERTRSQFEQRGVRLTLTPYFVRAASLALTDAPQLNSRFHEDALEIFEDHNIGLATALGEDGLIVPVITQAQSLDLLATARVTEDLVQRARDQKLDPKEVRGGTFTITNHGMGGSLIATPIINQPQSAILGIGKLQKRAVVIDDAVAIRPMAYVTLTIDHRALDGFAANRFLSRFVAALEAWS
jgi:2-oxoglutarate dehydrogenase E2 component (dihydrolipoamide succinyltransferase)